MLYHFIQTLADACSLKAVEFLDGFGGEAPGSPTFGVRTRA